LLFDDNVLHQVLLHTNRRLRGVNKKIFSLMELKAVLGVLIRAGADRDNLSSLSSLFDPKDSRPFYRCAISNNRFKLFLRYATFDNRNTRRERQKTDRMAAVQDIWSMFQTNLLRWYVPGEWLTVDEQLYGYRGYAPGRAYMSSKPAKYGIKIFWICDSSNGYALSGTIYSGKSSERQCGLAENIVLKLATPFFGSGRNIFVDRYFTSFSLCNKLLEKNLTMTGTILPSRRDVPFVLRNVKDRPIFSTVELWHVPTRIMVFSYVPKKSKNVLMMTSLHSNSDCSSARSDSKPDAVNDYNHGKGGVDLLDSCIEDFSVKRKTTRYPLVLFFNMIDVAVYNSYLIARHNPSHVFKHRKEYMKNLSVALANENMMVRANKSHVYSQAKENFAAFGFERPEQRSTTSRNPGKCHFFQCRKSTRTRCAQCRGWCCKTHQVTTCSKCYR